MSRTCQTMIFALCGSALIASAQTAPDNSKTNKRDQATSAVTPTDQGGSKADRELAQKIRDSVVKDKALSTYAHNAKIIVQDGVVTLRGPVRSESEKTAIASKAAEIAGAGNVHDELTIAPSKN